ncbi:MAG: metal ABC transporter permease [Planctomycetota bacterium]
MIEFFTAPFALPMMQHALIAALLAALGCASIGTYVVLRRMAFFGDALAHSVLPGLVIAVLLQIHMMIGALVAGLFTALGVGAISRRGELHEDSAIGILFTAMFALGLALADRMPPGSPDLTHMLVGNLLMVRQSDLLAMGASTIVVLIVLAIAHKELVLTTCDPLYASSIGLQPHRVRYVLLLTLALTVVTAIQAVGVVLTSALMITPPATARLLTRRLPLMIALSVGSALLSCLIGLYLSVYARTATSASIILASTALFLVALIGQRVVRARRRTA